MEKALLINVTTNRQHLLPPEASLQELGALVRTAGGIAMAELIQHRTHPDPATYLGKGKLQEVVAYCATHPIDLIVIDDDISPAQQKHLEAALNKKILDRTALILDIFSQRAHSHEAKLQVELAQLEYYLPRLTRLWTHLSRLGGGIGTRGPGETQLEVDRRRIRERIQHLKSQLERVRRGRSLHRNQRMMGMLPTASLIGYTNAGKSTLMNQLTHANVLAQDKLFATLDPLTRLLELPKGETLLITDTVGFIQKLPHQLVEAFQATLEETALADLLLHVIDVSTPDWKQQMEAVYTVLEEIGAIHIPMITVFNKIDRLNRSERKQIPLPKFSPAVALSAQEGEGIPKLYQAIEQFLKKNLTTETFIIPYPKMQVSAWLYQHGKVIQKTHEEDKLVLTVQLHPIYANIAHHALSA